MTETRQKLREFVITSCLKPDVILEDDVSLVRAGLVDSLGMLSLINFLEVQFGVIVDDADITPANFDSIAALAGYVERKRGSAP